MDFSWMLPRGEGGGGASATSSVRMARISPIEQVGGFRSDETLKPCKFRRAAVRNCAFLYSTLEIASSLETGSDLLLSFIIDNLDEWKETQFSIALRAMSRPL